MRFRPRAPGAPEVGVFALVRAVTYAALFIGLVLIYVPARLLSWSGIARPAAIEVQQVAGMVFGAAGAAVALWCIFTFASIGRGTPAAFRSASPTGDSGSLPFCAEPHVHWRWSRPRQRRALLRVAPTSGLYCVLLSRDSPFRGGVRGAHSTSNLRSGVRGLLPPGQAMVAEHSFRLTR